jgi:D-aminopeptidase
MPLDDQTKSELLELVRTAVNQAVEVHPLSDQEVQWVRLAIQAQADRAAFRKAVIEKTAGALFVMFVAGLCTLIWTGIKDHIK